MRPSADGMDESRPEAGADSDTRLEQSIPVPPGLKIGERPQTGALVALLSKVSSAPIEVVRAVEEFRALIDERVLGAIAGFRTGVVARMDVHEARITARFDRLDAKVDSLRTEIRILLAAIALVVALVVGLIFIWRL